MKRLLLGLWCLMLSGAVLAAGPYAVRKRVQASMLVTGSIVVDTDGSVKSFAIDKPEQLPKPVVSLIQKSVPTWRFVPVVRNGNPVLASTTMNLRVVAKPEGDERYSLAIVGSYFGRSSSNKTDDGETISTRKHESPSYPMDALRARVSGTVYMLMKVDRQGRVDEAAAEQVNLDVVGSDAEMKRWRNVLANASLHAARNWSFNAPTSGPETTKPFWLVRMPITFSLSDWAHPEPANHYGSWHAYVPGPHQVPAWAGKTASSASVDAIAAGSISEVGRGLQLTTPLPGA